MLKFCVLCLNQSFNFDMSFSCNIFVHVYIDNKKGSCYQGQNIAPDWWLLHHSITHQIFKINILKGIAISLIALSRKLFLYLAISFIILKYVFSVIVNIFLNIFLKIKLSRKPFDEGGLKARELNKFVKKVTWIHFCD